jgi:hypothetical protein
MGIWTWFDRYDAEQYARAALRAHGDGVPLEHEKAEHGHVEGIDTHRAWHALHVALTGQECGGAPPACHVVWGSPEPHADAMTSAQFVHPPARVREVADYLRFSVEHGRLAADLYAAIDLGVYVYAFDGWDDGKDIVQCGLFRDVLDRVTRFYAAAADAGQVVAVHRG